MTRAAMQLALDALADVARDLATSQCAALYAALGDRSPHSHEAARRDLDQIESAIEALSASLAQQDKPVAQVEASGPHGGCVGWLAGRRAAVGTKLYAAPQPAPVAQPLTEDQREAIIGDSDGRWCDGEFRIDGAGLVELLKAIERAHKIGGPL